MSADCFLASQADFAENPRERRLAARSEGVFELTKANRHRMSYFQSIVIVMD